MALHVAISALVLTSNTFASPSRKPPLGWSSWYAYGSDVTQRDMERAYSAMADRSLSGDGTSLLHVAARAGEQAAPLCAVVINLIVEVPACHVSAITI